MQTVTRTARGGPGSSAADKLLVGPDWLAAHLNDPDVRVIEVDVSAANYDDGHIDGAVLWNVYTDLKDSGYGTVGPSEFERLVALSGIRAESIVVFYGCAPALGLWMMKLYGHPDVRVLDCSRETWRTEGRAWSTATRQPPAGGRALSVEDRRIRADRAAVHDGIDHPGTTLVDVRSAAEYRGECFWPSGGLEPSGRAGHVPSAIHQPIEGLYSPDGSFRPAAELRAVFSPAVLDSDADLITYCTIGGRAATAWFVLTYLLGRDRVRVYDGSWAEWGRLPEAPVERG